MHDSNLNPQQSWLLASIRREPGITQGQLQHDLALAVRLGVPGLKVIQLAADLDELEERGCIESWMDDGQSETFWRPVYEAKEVKPRERQGALFA